jgi:hypothetical protein
MADPQRVKRKSQSGDRLAFLFLNLSSTGRYSVMFLDNAGSHIVKSPQTMAFLSGSCSGKNSP